MIYSEIWKKQPKLILWGAQEMGEQRYYVQNPRCLWAYMTFPIDDFAISSFYLICLVPAVILIIVFQ